MNTTLPYRLREMADRRESTLEHMGVSDAAEMTRHDVADLRAAASKLDVPPPAPGRSRIADAVLLVAFAALMAGIGFGLVLMRGMPR